MTEHRALRRDDEQSVPTILIFVAADVASFILFFAVFMSERLSQTEAFDLSASHLSKGAGLANTVVLVTSGWLVALAVSASRRGRTRLARNLVTGAAALGLTFVLIKTWEYGTKYREGISLTTDAFFAYYYVLTGVHLIHLLVGLGVLMTMRHWLRSPEDLPARQARIESGALYWHLVDLLWIFLFPLLYLQAA